MSFPLASICIPTFSRLTYLREAVASAKGQTCTEIEILIGDDGDSADIKAWSQSQAAADGRVRYLKTPQRLGLAGNWNYLAAHARADYLTMIGDDDRLLPNFVARLMGASHPDLAVRFSNHFLIDAAGTRLEQESQALTERYGRASLSPGQLQDPGPHVWRNGVPMCAALVRTADVKRLRFKSDINTPELELFVRLAAEGGLFFFVDDYLVEYRLHAGSETSRGLTVDRLAEYLEPVVVPAHVEAAKRDCLELMLLGGVAIRIGRSDLAGARRLTSSRYYPGPFRSPRALTQRLLLALPDAYVGSAYAGVRRLVGTVRRGRLAGARAARRSSHQISPKGR